MQQCVMHRFQFMHKIKRGSSHLMALCEPEPPEQPHLKTYIFRPPVFTSIISKDTRRTCVGENVDFDCHLFPLCCVCCCSSLKMNNRSVRPSILRVKTTFWDMNGRFDVFVAHETRRLEIYFVLSLAFLNYETWILRRNKEGWSF